MVTSITVLLILVPVFLLLKSGSQFSGSSQLRSALHALYQSSEAPIPGTYSAKILTGLPDPVQRYFKYALSEGQSYVERVRVKHKGFFRTNAKQKWKPIRGEEYFTCSPPGFVWFGRLSWASAVDKYINGKGNLKVKVASLIPVVNAKGKAADQGEFLRWLAEAVWYPTALLPSEKVTWEAIDDKSAKIIYQDEHIQTEGVFHFNYAGQITHFTAKRFMDDNRLENWTTRCEAYRLVQGMQIPYYAEASWNFSTGDFTYAKFELEEIVYE